MQTNPITTFFAAKGENIFKTSEMFKNHTHHIITIDINQSAQWGSILSIPITLPVLQKGVMAPFSNNSTMSLVILLK